MIKKINAAFFLVLCLLPALSGIAAALPSDISGHWAEKQIEDWISQSLASGYPDGTFQPDSLITRAEFMALTNRAFGFTGEAPINFQDVQSTDWYAAEVAKAMAGGYISGYGDGTIRPNDNITREEAAAMLTMICKLETPDNIDDKIAGFIDSAKIQWSKAAVASVAAMGYMTGYPDQTFQPGKPVTRAEAISTLDRAKAGSTDVAVNKPAVVPAVIDDKNPATGVTRQAGSTNITPPSFYSAYPKLSNGTSTSVYLLVRINENGKAYFVVLDSGSAAPTAQQVRAGQDSKGNAVLLSGSIALSGDDKGTAIINELEESKTYDIYVVAEDTMHNLQSSPVKVKLDRVAPVFVSAETNIDGTEARVTFSKEMDSSSKYKKQFKVLVNGINDTVTHVELDDDNRKVLILELDHAVLYGQTVTVAYTAGSVSAYDGTVLATFGAKSVTNSVIKPPSAPTGLKVSSENGGVLLEWNSVAGADGYTVYQSVQSDGPYKQISDSDRLRYRVTGLLNGVKYYFMVKAYNDGGESQNSIKAAAAPISLPNTPTGLTASAGNGQITLNWNAVTGAIGYKVYRADSSGGPFTQVWGGKETSYKSEGLANGKTYYFVVKAVNTSGDSNDSNIVSATAVDSPNPPTGLIASAENGQVILNWNAVAEATGYKIYRSEISGGPYTQISAGWALTSYVATGLTKGKTYCFVVQATNSGGDSANSNQVSVSLVSAPNAPTGLTASAGDGDVTLNWNAVAGATSYKVYQKSGGGAYTQISARETGTSYTAAGLTNGMRYYFKVQATNSGGDSEYSNEVSATPVVMPPDAPTGLTASAGNGQVNLNWNAVAGATSYKVYQSSGGSYTQITEGLAGTNYTVAGLTNGTTYYFVVKASNAGGDSEDSNQASAAPVDPA